MMRRWWTFLSGVIVGGGLILAVLNFHVIRARDGLHLVPKVDAQIAGTYVDISEFGPRDWLDHPEIFVALQRANQDELIQTATGDALLKGLDRLLDPKESRR